MSSNRNKRRRKGTAQSVLLKTDKRQPQSPADLTLAKLVPADARTPTSSKNDIILIVLLIILSTAMAYSNLYRNEFISFDDNTYITENVHVKSGLSIEGIKWAFSFEDKEGHYWQPLMWLTLMGIYQFFGLNSTAFHVANLLIHILNCLVLFFTLKRISGRIYPSGFVAILFALHPLNVESVAWAAEVKTPMSTLFGLLTVYSYAWYVERKNAGRYGTCLLFFCFSLMFKSHLATLPFILLLLDWWPLNRINTSRSTEEKLSRVKGLVLEKVPFFLLSAASVGIAVLSLKYLSPMEDAQSPDLAFRLENAVVSYVAYIFKLVLPIRLAVFYPNPTSYALWKPVSAVGLLIAASFAVMRVAWKRPWLAVGWLWFLGALLPMIGFVRGGLWPEMANRFTYFPSIGLFIVTAWGCAEIITRFHVRKRIVYVFAATVIVGMIMASRHYVSYWENGFSLFKYTLSVTEGNVTAYECLGNCYFLQKDYGKALECYGDALRINPEKDSVLRKIGITYTQIGNVREAHQYFEKALKINPGDAKTHYFMGRLYASQGQHAEAISEYKAALGLYPEYISAREQLGISYSSLGKYDEAIQEFSAIVRHVPNFAPVIGNLGLALARKGEAREALKRYEEGLRLEPNNTEIRENLGILLASLNQYDQAMAQFEEILRIEPDHLDAHINLGAILGMQGKLKPAIEHLQQALKIDPNNELARKNVELIQKLEAEHQ